jgi:hypothetical protein
MTMKLIREDYLDQQISSFVLDEETGRKRWYIEGVFAEQEQKNRNGRVYPKTVLEREVKRYVNERVKTGRAMGELNHPAYRQVNPERVCHRIVEIKQNGNDYIGKSLITDSNSAGLGRVVSGLLEDGCQLGVSTRGVGSCRMQESVGIVQPDYHMECIDVVTDPSANKAFVNGIMEGTSYVWDNGIIVEQACEVMQDEINRSARLRENEDLMAARMLENFKGLFGEKVFDVDAFARSIRNPSA